MTCETNEDEEYRFRRTMESLGRAVDRAMHEKRVTVRELAERVKVTPEFIHQVVDGTLEDIELNTAVQIGLELDMILVFHTARNPPAAKEG